MPPLILLVAGILGGAVLVRFVVREVGRVNRELDAARRSRMDDTSDLPTLRRDPKTGAYRPN